MSKKMALIIIDVQKGLFEKSDMTYRGEELLGTLQKLISRARGAKIQVIYVQHDGGKGHILAPGSPGWPIHPAIEPLANETVIHKLDPDSFLNTTLQSELDSHGISKIIIAGLQTELCIDTTIRRAYSLGYDVTVVEDGHSTCDSDTLKAYQIIAHHNSIFSSWFAKIERADEIDFKDL